MKVALCISGQMRGYLKAYPSVKKNIIDVFNPDIFIHTWDDLGTSLNLYRRILPPPMPHYLSKKFIDDSSYFLSLFTNFSAEISSQSTVKEADLQKLYNPKSCVVEKSPPSEKFDDFFGFKPPSQILEKQPKVIWSRNLFYKVYKCNELKREFEKQNNFKYDLVIRLRPDLSIGEIISHKVDKNTLYFRYRNINLSYQIADQYFYADSETMDKVCDIYNHIESLWQYYSSTKIDHKYFWAEGLFHTYVKKCHEKIILAPYRTEKSGAKSQFQLLDAITPDKSYTGLKDALIKDIQNLKEPELKSTFQKALSRTLALHVKKEKDPTICLQLIEEFETALNYKAFYARSILESRLSPDLAVESAKKALEQENSDEINFHIGKLLCRIKDYAEAKKYLHKSIELPDEYNRENFLFKWERHKFLGLAEEGLRNHYQALFSFMTAISLNEKSTESFYRAGKALYNLSRFSEALYYFNQALRLKPEHDSAAFFICLSYCQLGLYANSIDQCNIWVKDKNNMKPAEYKFLGPLAMATYYKGHKKEALIYMESYVDQGRYHEENILGLIQILAMSNKKEHAKKLLNSSLKKFSHLQSELNKFKVALK